MLLSRGRGPEATPLQAIGVRIRGTRGRRKIAVVAVARHLVRLAFYLLRDGTIYDARRLEPMHPAACALTRSLSTLAPRPWPLPRRGVLVWDQIAS